MTAKQCAAAIRSLEELVKLGFLETISTDDPDVMLLSYSLSKAYRLAAQLFPAENQKIEPACATDTLNVELLREDIAQPVLQGHLGRAFAARGKPALKIPNTDAMLDSRLPDAHDDTRSTSREILAPLMFSEDAEGLAHRLVDTLRADLDCVLDT